MRNLFPLNEDFICRLGHEGRRLLLRFPDDVDVFGVFVGVLGFGLHDGIMVTEGAEGNGCGRGGRGGPS